MYNIHQVLTGEMPFRGMRQSALAYHVLRGKRPAKPEDASDVGFSESLWAFTQNCWDRTMESRPKVGEIVTRLRVASVDWGRLMPPHSQVRGVVSDHERMSYSTRSEL